jgi:hypothetical protein
VVIASDRRGGLGRRAADAVRGLRERAGGGHQGSDRDQRRDDRVPAAAGTDGGRRLGRPFEDAEYLGDEPGLCPMCHLNGVVLRGREVECATCGAQGTLGRDLEITWTDLTTSVISMQEKRDHYAEIRETAQRHAAVRDQIEMAAAPYDDFDRIVRSSQGAHA